MAEEHTYNVLFKEMEPSNQVGVIVLIRPSSMGS